MGEPASGVRRGDAIDRLSERDFDLLVIGGGIVGAGIAAHGARAGLAVALVDAGDFGGATSSASSKLVHGGLRYLRLGDVRLVREAHHERRALTRVVAPHLVHRMPFLLPLYEGGPFRPAFVQSGILVYSTIARSRLHWLVSPNRARRLVPPLRVDGLPFVRAVRGRVDERCEALPRERAGCRGRGRNRAERRGGRPAPHHPGRAHGRGGAGGRRARHCERPRVRQRCRALGRRGAPARESFCGDLGTAQQGSTRARRRRRHVGGGADGAPGRRPRDLRRALVRDAPARDDGHDLERRSRRRRRRAGGRNCRSSTRPPSRCRRSSSPANGSGLRTRGCASCPPATGRARAPPGRPSSREAAQGC